MSGLTLINVGGLPLPRHFVGRKRELRQLRRALRDSQTKSAFIRGIGGLGKSSLAAKLAQRPGTDLDGVLVIRCHEVDALDIPGKLASFLQAQGVAGHAEAGNLLLNPTLPPAERAQRAAQLVANRRYLFVFDNFESVQSAQSATHLKGASHLGGASHLTAYQIADENLRGLLTGLLTANWRSLCLFTGRYRWRGYDEVVRQEVGLEIHLPQLSAPQTMMLMNNLSRLRQETRQVKIAMYRKVGGHPKTIELLNGWLKDGRVSDLLNDTRLDSLLTSQWEEYFLARLLARLNDDERAALTRLAIFQTKLGAAELAYAEVDEGMVRRWLDLSLLQREAGVVQPLPPQLAQLLETLPPAEQAKVRQQQQTPDSYTVHPVVADYLLGQTAADARTALHRWAAVYYGQPFVATARNIVAKTGQAWTDEEIEIITFSRNGVVGRLVTQTDDTGLAREALARALDWQRHLFAAGEVEAAFEIVAAVYDILARWGERDRAKGLLRRSIASLEGANQAVAQSNLATLLQQEGKLPKALATYQEMYETFAALDAKQQMASLLGQMGTVLHSMGELDEAIEKNEEAFTNGKENGNEELQAKCLHQLSVLYYYKEDYEMALAHSQAAETLNHKLNREVGVALNLHEQGIIYIRIAHCIEDEEKGKELQETAISQFQDSLTIRRRIGDESGTADTVGELGKLLLDAGQMKEAITAFNEALATYRKLGNLAKAAMLIDLLGTVHERQGQYAAALAKYREAFALYQQYSSPQEVARCQRNIARVQAKLGG